MKPTCREVRRALEESGASALRSDAAALRHVEECPGCFAALERVAALERGLAALEPVDAPEPVVQRLLERVAAEPASPALAPPSQPSGSRSFAQRFAILTALSAAAAAVLAMVVLPSLMRARIAPSADSLALPTPDYRSEQQAPPPTLPLSAIPRVMPSPAPEADAVDDRLRSLGYVGGFESPGEAKREGALRDAPPGFAEPSLETAPSADQSVETERRLQAANERAAGRTDADENADMKERAEASQSAALDPISQLDELTGADPNQGLRRNAPPEAAEAGPDAGKDDLAKGLGDARLKGKLSELISSGARRLPPEQLPTRVSGAEPVFPDAAAGSEIRVRLALQLDAAGRVVALAPAGLSVVKPWGDSAAALDPILAAARGWSFEPTLVDGQPVPVWFELDLVYRPGAAAPPAPTTAPVALAFLAERERSTGLAFQPASGYWANTWLPGDPSLRLLQARLAKAPGFAAVSGRTPALHEAAFPPRRPFDPPEGASVGLRLHADRAALDGEQRLLVEVGLQAIERAGGRRPALELALVLDLSQELALDEASAFRALALGFARARRSGDRFRLIVAGRDASAGVEPEAFRYGPLAVALDRALAAPFDPARTLEHALTEALEACARASDGAAGAVVVASAHPFGSAPRRLARIAHQGAVAGFPTSVVAVGPRVDRAQLDQLALAGQGHRRVLHSRDDALSLAERQLASSGRAVARALRLRIRLAPGVRLVGVIGSQRLDLRAAQRVREAERSLDLRLARELGLEADRGEDEEGIQIVIPSFEAGAAHSILLDVVAPGPGPIADVTLRYKDVVFLRNGVARDALRLPRGARPQGPLQRSVVASLLAHRLAADLEAAGDAVAQGDAAGAARRLRSAAELRRGLPAAWPGFAGDRELRRDVAMLDEYTTLLERGAATPPDGRRQLCESLRYAGRLKLLPRPSPLAAEGP